MNTVVIGTYFGDEGKAKVLDYLTNQKDPNYDIVVRFHGSSNAGHSVWIDGKKYVTHLVPCGVLTPGKMSVIAQGVVINPTELVAEIKDLRSKGVTITPKNLIISDKAHIVMPYHILEDIKHETTSSKPFGSTRKGVGPAYKDKSGRNGYRMLDLIYNHTDLKDVFTNEVIDFLTPFISNTSKYLHNQSNILFEGAQSTLLDIDHGTYPYVTSSNCVASYAAVGSGLPAKAVQNVIGVLKAYGTRVGPGPMPTECDAATAAKLRELGAEYGATTGRPRRIGWLDLGALAYAVRINGVDSIALTKLDILSHLDKIPVCTSYANPDDAERDLTLAQPRYITLDGWRSDISHARSMADLPVNARKYIQLVETVVGVPVKIVGVGMDRKATFET